MLAISNNGDNHSPRCLITTFMDGGSLSDFNHRDTSPDERVGAAIFFGIAGDVILALNYLHLQKPPILHLDVKSGNVLLDAGRTCAKLCDFGFARR